MFFSKQDELSLRKLLGKLKSQADASCATAGAHNAKEEAALTAIVAKYKLAPADLEGARREGALAARRGHRRLCADSRALVGARRDAALYKWRHTHDF